MKAKKNDNFNNLKQKNNVKIVKIHATNKTSII